ncbi:uncharacterized protein LOC127972874 [Carassius gibelio]|uniref:uncharacterized protein LOC127972874 n=1 Tax=Carassius gibelio TaxID=101364 RepID=UPI00227923DB|nr:uncharacterized protein LOC127972874 [Carassius gibelio]
MMNIPLLSEGEKADLTCSAPFPCPETPNITWWIRTRGGHSTYLKDNITLSTSESLSLSTLTLTPTCDDHNATIGCDVSYGSKIISTNRTLEVTYIFMNQASVGSVTITTVTKEHAGVYSCMRTFQNKTLNASITLNIIYKAAFQVNMDIKTITAFLMGISTSAVIFSVVLCCQGSWKRDKTYGVVATNTYTEVVLEYFQGKNLRRYCMKE